MIGGSDQAAGSEPSVRFFVFVCAVLMNSDDPISDARVFFVFL